MKLSLLLGASLLRTATLVTAAPAPAPVSTWQAADMFMTGIEWNDQYWDDTAGYLITQGDAKGRYDVRHTGWYATQLLARNGPGDVERAVRVFDNLVGIQYKDPSKLWYGDYPISPSIPEADSKQMNNVLPYKAWDPNWRPFIACAWIQALADYSHLLPAKTVQKVKESVYLAAKGDLYRVGGVDHDNLYPAYSNPWIMRVILQTWAGNAMNDKNMTDAGEKFGKQLYDLWQEHQTLSEFNSGTYSGVAMWALALWTAYAPADSKLHDYGAEILESEWEQLAELYNPNLKNVAGPWDRTYGFNMKQYANLIGAVIWGAIGRDNAPVPADLAGMMHANDFSFFPLIALSVPEMVKYLPSDAQKKLEKFSGEHQFKAQAYSPPFDTYPRNITAWISENITIGAETVAEQQIGGPAANPNQFSPAVVQWAIDEEQVGCISHYPTQSSIHAVAGPGTLNITYPNATKADGPVTFTFLVSGLDDPRGFKITGLDHLPNLTVAVKTNASPNPSVIYDYSQKVNEFWVYNVTYTMPRNYTGTPYVSLKVH